MSKLIDLSKITAVDRIAAEKQARLHYQTAYDYEMALQQAFADHRNRASTTCNCAPSNVKENKAGGMWYRRWYKAQHEITALQTKVDEATHAIVFALTAENERLREALKATPLRAKNESGRDFDDRQTAWLRDFYNPALKGKS